MRMPWSEPKAEQLELLDAEPYALRDHGRRPGQHASSVRSTRSSTRAAESSGGRPLVVPLDQLDEDPNNPRTEFTDADLNELADDIGQRGILEPIVVHPINAQGRCRLHFGAKRLRAAKRAGLAEVPVVVRDAPADPYAQVAENQKRHGLTPLDLARFIRSEADKGESNAMIARRLVMDPTTVAHHLALLDLPPELGEALKSGQCTSPKTLYELSKLHETQPELAITLLASKSTITRNAVAAARAAQSPAEPRTYSQTRATSLLAQANQDCARLELTLIRLQQAEHQLAEADVAALRQRVANLTSRSAKGSDSPTPARPTETSLKERDEEDSKREMAG
jgi:ParB family transcriptional regulator, chromosome partitioning protein